jgi:hypothetical protein
MNSCSFRPSGVWRLSISLINIKEPCLLIGDDTVLDKHVVRRYLVHYQYSGNAHDVIAGVGLVNLVWHAFESKESVLVDYRVTAKKY